MTLEPEWSEPRVWRQTVIDGRRWDVFVEASQGDDGRARVSYVFRTHDARPGRPAEERRTSGHVAAPPPLGEAALLQLFRDAE